MENLIQENIKEFLINLGVDDVGFCELDCSPIENQSELKYAVSIMVKLPTAVLKTIENRPTISYFHEYRSANAFLDNVTFRLSRYIEKLGYLAFPVPASQSTADDKSAYRSIFSHKQSANLSGLGFIGKSGLFISAKYGSTVRLATVLTSLPLKSEREMVKNGCGDCQICVKSCPAGAISGKTYQIGMQREDFFSAEKCSNNMKNYKDIGRGAVCGICIKVCPYNKL